MHAQAWELDFSSMTHEYYQFGGFRPQIQWHQSTYDDKALAKVIVGPLSPLKGKRRDGIVELTLGIKRNGSSHLLLTSNETQELATAMRLALPRSPGFRARDFESLSPIFFGSAEELIKKLATLKPKAGKGRGGDNSQANRGYNDERDDFPRAAFEHGRVFYEILNGSVNARKYGVEDVSWMQKVRVCSFVFNIKGVDDRKSKDKIRNPAVLDTGFCEAQLPSLMPDYGTAKHVVNAGNALLGRKQPKKPFGYGISETVPVASLPQRIQAFFKDHQSKSSDRPIVLLVYKKEETMNYLQNMQVDISAWRHDIKDLIISERPEISSPSRDRDPRRYGGSSYSRESSHSTHAASQYDLYPYGSSHQSRHSHSRSKSPHRSPDNRRDNHSRQTSTSSSKYQSIPGDSSSVTSARQSYAPVYVLDIHELYVTLMQTDNTAGVVDIARLFKMTDEEGWCAGNESAMIIDIWRSMVSSLPIDEQRAFRTAALDPLAMSSRSDNNTSPEPQDSDDERDPNDIVVKPQAQTQSAVVVDDPYNFDESDCSDDE